jgi:hypothetical protein
MMDVDGNSDCGMGRPRGGLISLVYGGRAGCSALPNLLIKAGLVRVPWRSFQAKTGPHSAASYFR